MWSIMLIPTLACLVLTGIHTYLGIHILRRGVIFVDLALAQIAALGSTFALLMGYELSDPAAYYFSLGFTILGAGLFSWTRQREEGVPHEALIGIVYVISAAAAVLTLDRAPGGAEHIRSILVGNILTVAPGDLIKTAALYTAIGLFHWILRKPFLLISFSPEIAYQKGMKVRLWDFLFYLSFSLIVTSSVRIGGVLLVFAYLIIPATMTLWFVSGISARLFLGWAVGAMASFFGLFLSYQYDLPTGATIICAFGATLLATGCMKALGGNFISSQPDQSP